MNPKNKEKKAQGQKKPAVEVEAHWHAVNEDNKQGVPTDSNESIDISGKGGSSGS